MKDEKQGKSRRAAVKVVYISSPMKVKTSASKFRALVQELTGRDSDVERYMENKEREESRKMVMGDQGLGAVDHSSSSSESLLFGLFDMDSFMPREEEGSVGMMFPSSFLCEPIRQMDGMMRRLDGV